MPSVPRKELGSTETISTRAGSDSAQKATILTVSDLAIINGRAVTGPMARQPSVCRNPYIERATAPMKGRIGLGIYICAVQCGGARSSQLVNSVIEFTDGVLLFTIQSSSMARDDASTLNLSTCP